MAPDKRPYLRSPLAESMDGGVASTLAKCAAALAASSVELNLQRGNDMTHDRKIDYIEFGATDIAATKKFYGEVFGWKFTGYGPDYTSFEDGRIAG